MEEKVFYEDDYVYVSQSRFVTGGKTYAMRNIASVSIQEVQKSKFWPILLIIVGGIILSTGFNLIGIGLLAIGVFWFYSIKDEYSVRIQSNSGESDALISPDKEYVISIVESINEAIIYRG